MPVRSGTKAKKAAATWWPVVRWIVVCMPLVFLAGCLLSPAEEFLNAAPAAPEWVLEPTNYDGVLIQWGIPGGTVFIRTSQAGAFSCDWELDPALDGMRAEAPKGAAPRNGDEVGVTCSFNGEEFGRGTGTQGSIVSADGVPEGEITLTLAFWTLRDLDADPLMVLDWVLLEPSIKDLRWSGLEGCAKLGRDESRLDWHAGWTSSAVGGRLVANWTLPFEIRGYSAGGGTAATVEPPGPDGWAFEIGLAPNAVAEIQVSANLVPSMADTVSRPPGDEGGCTGVVHHEATALPLELVFEPWHGPSIDLSAEPTFDAWLEAV